MMKRYRGSSSSWPFRAASRLVYFELTRGSTRFEEIHVSSGSWPPAINVSAPLLGELGRRQRVVEIGDRDHLFHNLVGALINPQSICVRTAIERRDQRLPGVEGAC